LAIGAPRVDIQPAAARVARINTQAFRLAVAQNIAENTLYALLVKLIVMAE